MSDVGCCAEFSGWCKSFTRTEVFLAILECILLVVFTVLLGFTILHFIVCSQRETAPEYKFTTATEKTGVTKHVSNAVTTVPPDVKCTWNPLEKTTAATHYYEDDKISTGAPSGSTSVSTGSEEDLEDYYRALILALVKIQPGREDTVGCVLTKISKCWVLTAASCVEAVREAAPLEAYAMVEEYWEAARGKAHAVAEARRHPRFRANDSRYDLMALRSVDDLGALELRVEPPSILEHYFVTIGETLSVWECPPHRTVDARRGARGARRGSVQLLPGRRCGAGGGGRAARGWCVRCGACAGGALLRRRRLLGVRAGLGCGALFASAASPETRAWLGDVVGEDYPR